MKILIADKFESIGVDGLKKLGAEVISDPSYTEDTLGEGMKKIMPDVLIVRSKKVTKATLEASKGLKMIIRAGAGYDTIDVATATTMKVPVTNCPGKNSIAVAELAFSLVLACDRRVPDATAELKNGQWNKAEYSKAKGINGSTIGIIGYGSIGKAVAVRAKAFGMKVIFYDPFIKEDDKVLGSKRMNSLNEIASGADVITLHMAATNDNKGIINESFFASMKKGAYFINTSRGSVVDYKALRNAIKEKNIRAGLDVFEKEPKTTKDSFTDEILSMPGVYATPHIGASTDEAQNSIALEVVRIVERLQHGEVINKVN